MLLIVVFPFRFKGIGVDIYTEAHSHLLLLKICGNSLYWSWVKFLYLNLRKVSRKQLLHFNSVHFWMHCWRCSDRNMSSKFYGRKTQNKKTPNKPHWDSNVALKIMIVPFCLFQQEKSMIIVCLHYKGFVSDQMGFSSEFLTLECPNCA